MKQISTDTQLRLIAEAMNSASGDLSQILTSNGLTYDSLRYVNGTLDNFPQSEVTTIDKIERREEGIPCVSFFSGAGGLDIGFELAGFNNLISIEFNEIFCNTLRLNNPDKLVIGPPNYSGDVSKREEISELLLANGITENFNGVFHGGPPCQSFSVAATQRFNKESDKFKRKGFEDESRGMLIFDYLWYIKHFRPLAFLIENVSGIKDFDSDGKIKAELDILRADGYNVLTPQVVNASYYGVPQNRKRWIVMGTRGHNPIIFPQPSTTPTACGKFLMKSLDGCANHITREHTAASIERYMVLEYGKRDHLGRVDRLDPNLPSKTVIAGGTKGGGRSHLHPFFPRTLSVRECARLQTFPDAYVFTGSTARQFTQVGNAVPPYLAYQLATQILEAIRDDYANALGNNV